ncbi:hypothetical protein BC936DRAFT_139856 [Jimgerdemannia flammicorona]|uniref:Uncharacterized protein n=1 Tax=Jimgerdemannia flammicorona TaxID=994334 RepID=A0A433DHC9_9FUNG|nr:hypothetical protein BC936DRAFT_139856 [Jimgerdemannia flammicorona]
MSSVNSITKHGQHDCNEMTPSRVFLPCEATRHLSYLATVVTRTTTACNINTPSYVTLPSQRETVFKLWAVATELVHPTSHTVRGPNTANPKKGQHDIVLPSTRCIFVSSLRARHQQ